MENPNETTAVAVKDQFLTEVNPLNESQVAAIATAQVLNFDMASYYWEPTVVGESKRLIFQEIRNEMLPSFTRLGEFDPVDVAYFVEVYIDQDTAEIKQRMIRTASTKILNFLKKTNGGVPRHACIHIEFKGEKQGKKFRFDDFAIYPVIQKLNTVEAN